MGAGPSGWLPPPYNPAPVAFSGWCAVDINNPAVNYNNQYALRYDQNPAFLPAQDMRWYGSVATPIAAATTVRGVGFANADPVIVLASYGFPPAAFGASYTVNLYAIQTAFNPAVLTWNTAILLSTQLMMSIPVIQTDPAVNVLSTTGTFSLFGIVGATAIAMGAITYGFALTMTAGCPAGNSPNIRDQAYLAPGARAQIGNWRVLF